MTVAELIAALQALPGDAQTLRVVMFGYARHDGGFQVFYQHDIENVDRQFSRAILVSTFSEPDHLYDEDE